MPHAPGWSLVQVNMEFLDAVSSNTLECVFHYNGGTLPGTDANALALATAWDGSGVVAAFRGMLTNNVSYDGVNVSVNDGMQQGVQRASTPAGGTAGTGPLPQVMCAIASKRCAGLGRHRYGHTCIPGIDVANCVDENDLTAIAMTNYQTLLDAIKAGNMFGALGPLEFIMYDRKNDKKSAVFSYLINRSLRTNRHRTPGRGI